MMTGKEKQREVLLPSGVPRWIRIYDNGGKTFDRFTVVFTGRYGHKTEGETWVVGMSTKPFHPQGFGQHGGYLNRIDVNKWGFAPAIGRSNYLGKRILFGDLPPDCQKLILSDYKELWDLQDVGVTK